GTVPAWTTLSWSTTTPSSTAVTFQAAASKSVYGPFNFVGPDGTAATFFTSGATLAQFNGKRYLKYRATLSTPSSTATPAVNDVTACFGAAPTTLSIDDVSQAEGNAGTSVWSFTVSLSAPAGPGGV